VKKAVETGTPVKGSVEIAAQKNEYVTITSIVEKNVNIQVLPSELAPYTDPYPRKCYLPFILYPPAMYRNEKGHRFAIEDLGLDQEGDDFVLYLSIPFCRVRCKGCPYFIDVLPKSDHKGEEDLYIDALIKDIRHWGTYRKWSTGRLRAVYLGGGTGTIIKTSNLKRIVDTVFETFQATEDCCFTLEGNARDYDEDKLDYVASSRITRVSLGVQSFQPEILKIIGSPHAADESISVIKALQARGFTNIQMDLMFNMPEHTIEIWQKDLQVMTDLGIPHFTVYLYRQHEGTPQDNLIKAGKVKPLLDPETPIVKSMIHEVRALAVEHGYNMYMVDHFAKPGYENKYNHWSWKIYTDALAIGSGSYSYFNGYRLGTNKNVKEYIETVDRGEFLISTITPKMDERVEKERYVIFTLLYFKVEFEAYRSKYNSEFLDDFGPLVERLKEKGLVEILSDRMELTPLGMEWHSNVILEFFNPMFWGDEKALNEPNWSMNVSMVEVGAHAREYWLGK
jgi:oxygen-independent coproporphyrinogen-3 oxidase